MLKALYDYGIANDLAIPAGFMKKPIKAYILLTQRGDYLGIELPENDEQICPDIGSMAQGPDKCNPLAEKVDIVLGISGKKPSFFREILKDGAEKIPQLEPCLNVLENAELFFEIRYEAQRRKLKGMDRISFKVDGVPVAAADGVKEWWQDFRRRLTKEQSKKGEDNNVRCLITGELITPIDTVPTVSGLQVVGGHSKGEALICFDKAAFCSYGLKKSANAPVSETAFSVIKDAMNDLLRGSPAMYNRDGNRDFNPFAPVFSGMKFVHWYDKSLSPADDPISSVFGGIAGLEDDDDEDDEETPQDRELEEKRNALKAKNDADALVESIKTGEKPKSLHSSYYIMLISGANGRAMVRRYEHGSYGELCEKLKLWHKDISLCDDFGKATIRQRSLKARLTRLVKYRGKSVDRGKLNDQLKKELAGITPSIVTAIINGTALPDSVAAKALLYIRSQMLTSTEEDKYPPIPDGIACQWLKVWLARRGGKRNEEVSDMEYYKPEFSNAAYHCGALMAVYASLQYDAMEKLNTGVVQRYYASASTTPALVLGTLERMASIYLSKLKDGLRRVYENRLNDTYAFFDSEGEHSLPKTLDLEGQSYFALGYRQMSAQISHDKKSNGKKEEEE